MPEKEKVCECLRELQWFMGEARRGLDLALRHDLNGAIIAIQHAKRDLTRLEDCLGVKLEWTRDAVVAAAREAGEGRATTAAEQLGLAQHRVFGEVRDKVCREE